MMIAFLPVKEEKGKAHKYSEVPQKKSHISLQLLHAKKN